MSYSTASIDRVRESDIVKTIGNFVELKKAGSNYKCKSPFATEKTASFVVSPVKQIFKCYSTGFGGDGIAFVMQHESVDFLDAVRIISKIHNIFLDEEAVTPEIQRQRDIKTEMYTLTKQANRSFVNAYRQLEPAHWAKKMIADRGFDEDSLINFQIGYSCDQNKLTKWAIEKATVGTAKELGLIKTKESSTYDFFRSRLMFPIHNEKGSVVGFGGRQSNDPKLDSSYKYLNSKENPIYDKSSILYGLYQAKRTINKLGAVILTEGYTDVIAMHQHNCENTVASCGTALTTKHVQLLKKYAEEVVLLRDGDPAGLRTMLKKDGDIDLCLSHGLNVSICILPDGEDPDSFARIQLDMHTWINDNKQDAVLYKASQFEMIRDRYQADLDSTTKQFDLLIEEELNVKIDLTNLKGDELKSAKEINKEVAKNIGQLKAQKTQELSEVQKIDPDKKAKAVTNVAETLFLIKHEVKRTEYVKQVAKLLQIGTTTLKAEIGKFEIKATEVKETEGGKLSMRGVRLPDGADKEEYLEGHGFVTVGNSYHFQRTTNTTFFQGTTFKLEPLFHIQGDKENKRLCEITNLRGKKKLIDFDSDMLANFNDFKKYLFRIGGFMFLTHNGVRAEHFDKFVYRFEEQFEPALELLTMGHNTKGFYAFANGVFWEGKFRPVNKYGIMNLEGIDATDSEYNQKIENYYSPAFSVMHRDNQLGDDVYENDRYFVYKESAITLDEWMEQLISVFGDKGITGILFNFGSLFRDLFLSHYTSFPLLGGFGETGSGKSAFGEILQNFFYYRMPGVDLTQVTTSGLSKTLTRTTNAVVFCDEFQDRTIKPEVASLIMGGWNGNGRVKSKDVGSTRTTVEKIFTSIYYCGQFMPTFKDGALGNRTIGLYFKKENHTLDQKTKFTKLLNSTTAGISSLTTNITKHRSYFEQQLPRVFSETERKFKEALGDQQYDERIFKNTAMLYASYAILKDKIQFPFTEIEVTEVCKELIMSNSEQINDSNGLTEFWNILTFLFENSSINDKTDFKIDITPDFKITQNREQQRYQNTNGDQILYLRLESVYQKYNRHATPLDGIDVIGKTTLREYFKSRPYFIGLIKAKHFGPAGSQSCYAFNYTMMRKNGLVTLEQNTDRDPENEDPGLFSEELTKETPDI